MKLLLFFCIVMVFQVAANTSAKAQPITLALKNAPLDRVFAEIKKQRNVNFVYSESILQDAKPISVNLHERSLEEVMRYIVVDQPFTYEIVENIVVFKAEAEKAVPMGRPSVIQQRSVSGRVTDSLGTPLAGATVSIVGSSRATITDAGGKYKLDDVEPEATLSFSLLGHQTYKTTADQLEINVTLASVTQDIDEVIVVGFGTQKKEHLTGAVTQVSGERLQHRMSPNVTTALQGIIPNLNISINNVGGQPGFAPEINLRGPGSLSGGQPFVLVDGVPQDLHTLNPYDIASVTVLKDASASAIYGVRAAYGVILVTTKQGTGSDKPTIAYNGNTAWSAPLHLPQGINSMEWALAFNEALANAGQAPYFTGENLDRISAYLADPNSIPENIIDPSNPVYWASFTANANTDWFAEFYKPWSFTQSHDVNVSGGSKKANYFLSGSFFDQGAQFRYGDEGYQRYNLTANLSSQITDWMRIDFKNRYTRRNIDMPHDYAGLGSYYHEIPRRWPTVPVRDGNGHFHTYGLQMMTSGGRDKTYEDQLLNTLSGEIEPVKNWKINVDINIRQNFNNQTRHEKTAYGYFVDNSPFPVNYTFPNWFQEYNFRSLYNSNNIYTSYELQQGDHYLKGLVGFQSELMKERSITGRRVNLVSDDVPSLTTATGTVTLSGTDKHWATVGYFGRFNYNFAGKYLVEVAGRYDGTSRFGEGKRWGWFPSFSVGYNVSKENFWPFKEEVSEFKLRGSYGTLGNQDILSSYYPYLANIGINTQLEWIMGDDRPIYTIAPALVSSGLTWEKSTTLNVGFDVVAVKNKLSLTFDWYRRNTYNMFGPLESFPAVLGTDPPQRNNASLATKGFEFSANWRDRINAFGYSLGLILADNTTTITDYQNNSGILSSHYTGKKLNEIWGYTTASLFQSDEEAASWANQSFIHANWRAGDVAYADLNNDGAINNGKNTLADHGDLSVIGNSTPRFAYALNLGADWKGFDVQLFWQGVAKRDLAIGGNFFWGFVGSTAQSTIFEEHLDYWSPTNADAYYPKPYMSSEMSKNQQTQTRYLQSGAYLRLKNMQLGYTLPQQLVGRINVSRVRIYLTGENLLTFSQMSKVFDPEGAVGGWGAGKAYPLAKTWALGLNLNF